MPDPPTAQPDGAVPNTTPEGGDTLATKLKEISPFLAWLGDDHCTKEAFEHAHTNLPPTRTKHGVNQPVRETCGEHLQAMRGRLEPKALEDILQPLLGSPTEKTMRENMRKFCDEMEALGHPRKLRQELIDHGAGKLLGNEPGLLKRDRQGEKLTDINEDVARKTLFQQGMKGCWATNNETNRLMKAALAYAFDAKESWLEKRSVDAATSNIALIENEEAKASALKELNGIVEAHASTAKFRARFASKVAMYVLFVKGVASKGRQLGIDRSFGKNHKDVALSDVTFDSVCTTLVRNQQYFFEFVDLSAFLDLMDKPKEDRVRMLMHCSVEELELAIAEKKFLETAGAGASALADKDDSDA